MRTSITRTPADAVEHCGVTAAGRVDAATGQARAQGIEVEQRSGVLSAGGPRSAPGSTLGALLSVAVRRPGTVGAVWPSSAALAGLLASVVPDSGDPVVVEMGPGTGAVSTQIARRLPAGGRHLAVEVDPVMVGSLAQRLPELEVINDACSMRIPPAARGIHRADAVVSGVPGGCAHRPINSSPEDLDQMCAEVVGCRDILQRTTGTPGSNFRPSQSPTANRALLAIAGQAGYRTCLSYNVDSMDFTDPGAQTVRANVAAAGPGAVVSMHLGHRDTVTALPDVSDDLKRRGLAAVTVTTLLFA